MRFEGKEWVFIFEHLKVSVLIVEDDKNEVKIISNALLTLGILSSNIKDTNDITEALAITKIEEPTIIFINIHHLSNTNSCNDDGIFMLRYLHHIYKDCDYYQPFTVAISSNKLPNIQKIIAKYSKMQLGKDVKDYPIIAFQKFLMSIGVSFEQLNTSIDESSYMNKLSSLIKSELEPFNFSSLKKSHQSHIIELIYLIIPTLDKRNFSFSFAYKKIAKKYNVQSSDTIKTSINRAFANTFIQTTNFLDLYTGNNGKTYPKQKEFYTYIASSVQDKLLKL